MPDGLRHFRLELLNQFVLIAAILVSLTTASIQAATPDTLQVAVSISPQREFVEQVAGGTAIDVFVLLPPGANPSTYELTPGQMKKLSEADAFFEVGSFFPFEQVWLHKISDLNASMSVFDCAAGIGIKSGVASHADHGDPLGRDPHVWCSLTNARTMIDNIARGLAAIDPEDSLLFAENAAAYKLKLDSLDAEIKSLFADCQNREFLIYHPAWGYFAADYGLIQVPIEFEGKEPHFEELKKLIQLAKSKGLKTVFVSPQFNPESARMIAREVGARIEYLDPMAGNYLENMREVALKIAAALGKQ